jgi:Mg2+ and Co2+ transporter CorA
MPQPAYKLTPEDGRKGALAVNEQRRLATELRRRQLAVADAIVDEVSDLSPAALRAVLAITQRVEDELAAIEVSEALDLQRMANTAEILHRIHRLASGQSTSNNAHATLTDEERAARLAQLRAMSGQREESPARSDAGDSEK